MYAGLYPREWEASIAASMQRSDSQDAPKSPGVFDNFGGALADIVPHAALTTANAWSGILDAFGKAFAYGNAQGDAWLSGRPAPDMEALKAGTVDQIGNNTLGPALRQEAKKWTPNPAETGIAGQIVFGVGESLAKAGAYTLAGPTAPVLFGADVGINRADELKDQGVDGTTANLAGVLSGVAGGVGMKVPAALGATRLQSAAIGAAVNPALNVAETGGTRLLLQHADYDLIARQYQPFDPLSLTMSAAMGGAFGAAFHHAKPAVAPAAQADAAVSHDIPTPQRRADGEVGHAPQADAPAGAASVRATPAAPGAIAIAQARESLRAELLAEAGNRAQPGEIPAAREQLAALQHDIERIQDEQVFKAEAKAAQRRGLSRKQAEAAAREVIGQRLADLQAQSERLNNFIDANRRAAQAEQDLDALDHGQIPGRLARRIDELTGIPPLTPDEHAAALTMHEVHVRDDDLLTAPGDDVAAYAGRDAQHLARHQLETGQAVEVAAGVDVDPAVVAERAEHITRRLNHGDALLGQALDFGGRSVERLETEYARLTDHQGNNLTDGGRLIDTDLVRELSPEYRQNRLRASDVHEAASALTKELYARALARPVAQGRDAVVQFLAGGGGSGKSFARKTLLSDSNPDIRMDGTFSNLDRARKNIDAALASGRFVDIVYVYRSAEKAAAGVIARAGEEGRTVPIEALAQAHEKAPQVVQTLAREYHKDERVQVRAIWNDGDSAAETRFIPLKEIPHVNRTDAEGVFRRRVEEAHDRGEIPDFLWRAFVQRVLRPETGQGTGSHAQDGPAQRLDALTGGSSEPGASSAPESDTLLGKVASVVSQMLGRDAPRHPFEPAGPQAATPEQQRAFEWMQKHPDALLPGGEGPDGAPLKGPDGEPILMRAEDLLQQAADVERQAQKETAAFGAAVGCALRYPDET